MIPMSRFTVVSRAASATEYARDNKNDSTTTYEYFTGTNVVQIQPS